jgi:Tfp pilus assembly protein PilP
VSLFYGRLTVEGKNKIMLVILVWGFLIAISCAISSSAFQTQTTKKEEKSTPPEAQTEDKKKEEGIDKVMQALAEREKEREKKLRHNVGGRDPFKSLLAITAEARRERTGPGVMRMLISELKLVGIVKSGNKFIASFSGSDNVGYFLRVNDRVYDGWVKKIGTDYVIFEQEITDPYSLKKTREVVKKLYPEVGEG